MKFRNIMSLSENGLWGIAGRMCTVALAAVLLAPLSLSANAQEAEIPGQEAPKTPADEFQAIQKLTADGSYQAAARSLQAFIRANATWKGIEDANRLYGITLIQSGDVTVGSEVLARLIDAAPEDAKNAPCYFYRGKALEALGDFPGAVLAYDVLVRRFANNDLAPQAALNEAVLAEKILQNVKRARQIYELFVQNYPQHESAPAVLNHLALMAEQANQFDAAVKLYVDYAQKYSNDAGNPAMNGSVAGSASALWHAAELSAARLGKPAEAVKLFRLYDDLAAQGKLPQAEKGKGYRQATLIALGNPEAGDANELYKLAHAATPDDEDLRVKYANWLAGPGKNPEGAAAHYLALATTSNNWDLVRACLDRLGPQRVKAYLDQNPRNYAIFNYYLQWFKDGNKRGEGRAALDQWLSRNDIGWKTAICNNWAELTHDFVDYERLLKAANEEGRLREATKAALVLIDTHIQKNEIDKAQAVLGQTLEQWAAYPDFSAADFAARLGQIAVRQPLMVKKLVQPKPAEGQANPPADAKPVEQMVVSPEAKAARENAINVIRKYNLNRSGSGAAVLAELATELNLPESYSLTMAALQALVEAKDLDGASTQVDRLFEKVAPDSSEMIDVLAALADKGPQGWEKYWNEKILPKAKAELDQFSAVNPPTELSRYAKTQLLRFFDAKQSVNTHQEFLKNHGGSPRATTVQRNLWAEMQRAGIDPTPQILQAIKDIEKNPAIIYAIPLDRVPAGPEGVDLYIKNVRKINTQNKALAADLLLSVARLQVRFNRMSQAMESLRELVGKYGDTPQAIDAKRLSAKAFEQGFFTPGLTQADAEQAFAWNVDLVLSGQEAGFQSISGNLWRMACHPAYRLHSFEDLDSQYMYSTHGYLERQKQLNEYVNAMYATYPGDGIGPQESATSGTTPYGGGDRFMLYRWSLLRAPVDGVYQFWFAGDDYVGIDIDGRSYNIPERENGNQAAIELTRGLHILRIIFADWGGGSNMYVDWQAPGGQRMRMGPEAFGSEVNPLILSIAAGNQGAYGLAQWDAYARKFPNDVRGRMMRLETLALLDPSRAMGELEKLMQQYPGNLHYKALYADCQWRIGRKDDALKTFAGLADQQEHELWACSYNDACREIFLRGLTPIGFEDEYQDRMIERGDWNSWLSQAEKAGGDNAALTARVSAEGTLEVLKERVTFRQSGIGRVNSALAKEKAQYEAAKALAEKPDASAEVKAQALAAVAYSQKRVAFLEQEVKTAQAELQKAENQLASFQKAVGLGPDEPAIDLPLKFAASRLEQGTVAADSVFKLAARLVNSGKREAASPFLEYVVAFSSDAGQVRWSVDRLVELGIAGEDVTRAAQILASMGMRNPRDGIHAEWLRRSCDLALQAGDVYTFARSAQVLAKLHAGNNRLTGYLDRLGEVFEKAGNYTSAEYEYRRVIRSARDPEQKRRALLSLAGLYEKLGRSHEALKVLSNLVRLDLLDGKQESGPAPKAVKEGEAPVEDAAALLLAARCYLSLEKSSLALNCYDRAAAQKEFGAQAKPDRELLMDLAHACVIGNAATAKQGDEDQHAALPVVVLQQGEKALNLVDTIFRFYSKQMDAYQTVQATLIRVDANIMMRNYPRAVEEVREAAKAAGNTSAKYLADLKMGELHLATDNPDQAIPIFKKLAKMNSPEVSPIALFWLGSTQLNMNKREDAIESFRILWERYSDNQLVRQAIYTIARTYAEQGAFLDAIRLYEAVGAIHSKICEKVAPGDVLTVKVWDADHFLGTGEYTIPVQVRSSSGDLEHMQLDMNKINHSLFLGTIRTELGEATPDDKVLQVYGTDIIYVTYVDRFKGLTRGEKMTAANVAGEKTTSLIQVVEDADLKVSPTLFVEREEDEEDIYVEKTEAELEEEKRLKALSAKLERGEAVVRPGNYVYVRLQDGDLDVGPNQDEVAVNVFTYAAEIESKQREILNLERQMSDPLGLRIGSDIPSNGQFGWNRHFAPQPDNRPRLDEVRVVLKETEPHSGIFYGKVQTNVNGPTAIASDTAGQNAAVYAIDGKNGAQDAWMGFIDNKPGKWLEIDMKELREVNKIVWDRGQGADDRYMINYTVTLRGEGAPVVIEQKGNRSAHNVEIPLKAPVKCRWIRFTALTYEGDAPAISQVQVFDKAGELVVPPKTPPTERVKNNILEFNVGDCMAAEYLDEENFDPARPVTRTSNALGVAYVDGHIDAVCLSQGRNPYKGSLFIDEQDNTKDWYARRTKRIGTEDVLRVAVLDPDLDIDDMLNTATCEIFSSTGDKAVVKAEEIGPTAAIFQGRIQLSPNPAAVQDDSRLYVENGGFIMLRYMDEQNRNPGNAIYRESFIFVADDEVADFALDTVAIESPQAVENQIEPPHWTFSIKEPDQALPGIDRVEMNAMSFATGDYAKFVVLLRNLDGLFSSRLPVGIGDKPVIPLRKDADPRDPRQIRTLDDWGWWERQQKLSQGKLSTSELEEENYLDIPLAVVGDDLVWVSYKDTTAAVPAGREFVAIADNETLGNLQKLGVRTDLLPDEAKTTGITVELNDPYLDLIKTVKDREKDVLYEIARKKLHYRKLIGRFDAALERIGKRIDELTPKVEKKEEPETAQENPPEAIGDGDAPLTETNPTQIEGFEGEDLMATEDLILAASLRRDRDALVKASKALQARLKTFERYKTEQYEQDILQKEKELREQGGSATAEDAGVAAQRQRELPWYRKPDWWKNCGGIIPGTLLDVRLNDPDLQGETVPVLVAALGNELPSFQQFTAQAVPGEKGVYEVKIKTSSQEEEGTLCLKGVRDVLLTYKDTIQSKFPSSRSGFLSLASNATMEITGPDFLEAKSSFHLGEEIYIMIHDTDMDKTSERDYVWVEITSDVGDKEIVPICESQNHTGIFRGSIRTEYSKAVENDGVLSANFGGTFSLKYVDELWRSDSPLPPTLTADGSFVPGSDGTVEIFARQLKRGSLQRDVLFSTALAEYELGKSSTEMGAIQRGRQHLLESREKYRTLLELYPDDPVCAHATYYLGNIEFLLGNFEAAVASLQEVIDRWPKSEFKAKALYKLGTCHLKAGHIDKSVECFVNLAYHHKDSPLVADSMLTLAQYFSDQEKFKVAAGIGYAFVRKFPAHDKTANMYLRLAGWLIMEKRLDSAVEVLEEAEKVLPDSSNMAAFLYWHADCIFKQHRPGSVDYKRGIILLQRVTYDYPNSKWAKYAARRLAEEDVLQR